MTGRGLAWAARRSAERRLVVPFATAVFGGTGFVPQSALDDFALAEKLVDEAIRLVDRIPEVQPWP